MRTMNITRMGRDIKTRGLQSRMDTGRWKIEQKDELIVQEVITISNHDFCARREKYTKEIREELDPRDKEYTFPFNITFNITEYLLQKGITLPQNPPTNQQKNNQDIVKKKCEEYAKLRRAVFNYVSEVCETVSSISFRLLSKGELNDGEAKAFAVRIILANIQSVLTDLHSKLEQFAKKEGKPQWGKQFDDLVQRLTKFIDEQLSQIFSQLAGHYPQAPPAGATASMREVIVDLNRAQDEQNNLIFSSDIKISKYVKYIEYQCSKQINSRPGDYTGFVMEVINQAIEVTRREVDKDLTLFDKFQQFNETLFALANTDKKSEKLSPGDKIKLQKLISSQRVSIFHNCLQAKQFKKDAQTQQQKKEQKQHQKSLQFKQRIVQQYKKHHKVLLAQKIPNHVKPFSHADIKEGNFRVNNSTVLRIMTKWAESLQEIFEKAEQEIGERIHKVKNFNNNLYEIQGDSEQYNLRDIMIERLQNEYVEVKKKLNTLKQENTSFHSYILSEKEDQSSYLKRFTKVREASAQINSIAIEYTKKYLCILIHHLVQAGFVQLEQDSEYTTQSLAQENLVVFKVGDLMRSKLQCSEKSFINVMNMLQQLDSSKQMEGKFKLVRIKNKLGMRDNNVLINYMFMGKVQCELQLSVQKMDERDKHYYEFCHFLYQLTRGKFGVITECAIVACQHDSIINSSTDAYYRPKCYEAMKRRKTKHKIHEKDKGMYKCINCGQLKMGENTSLFQQESFCNQCIVKQEGAQKKMRNNNEFLLKQIRIRNYGQIDNGDYIISAKNQKTDVLLKLYRAWRPREQIKLFLVEINSHALSEFQEKEFQYDKIDYFNILNKKKKNQDLKELTYNLGKSITPQALQSIGIHTSLLQKIEPFFQANQVYRMEKNTIKQIQFKSELIVIKRKRIKWNILKKVASAYFSGKFEDLRYRKYKKLDWSHIKHIDLQKIGVQDTKQVIQLVWLTQNCTTLDLSRNIISQMDFRKLERLDNSPIKDISLGQLYRINIKSCTSLIELSLDCNNLKKIDISPCINLQTLRLFYNQLQHINLSSNIHLKQLFLSHNKLKQIDISSNVNLEIAYFSQNQIQKANTGCNKNLKSLYLDSNKLMEVDVSQNTNLQQIRLIKNKLEHINLQVWVSQNPKVRSLKFWCSQIQYHFLEELQDSCRLKVLYRKQQSQKHDRILAELKKRFPNYTLQSEQKD